MSPCSGLPLFAQTVAPTILWLSFSRNLWGVDRSHGAVWKWVHTLSEAQSDPPTAEPSRVAVDEKQIEVSGEKKWLYAATDTDSKLLLEIDVFSRHGTDPAAAFLHRLTEKHDFADAEFLVDAGGYLTALARHELSGRLDYRTRSQSKNGSRPSPSKLTASIRTGAAVKQAPDSGYDASDTTTIMNGRTKRSTVKRHSRQSRTIVLVRNSCSFLEWRVDPELYQSLSSARRVSQKSGC